MSEGIEGKKLPSAITHVRTASVEDLPFLMQELAEFSKLFHTKLPLFEKTSECEAMLRYYIERHVFLISTLDNETTGFILGYLGAHPFNPKIRILSEMLWWVKEEFRGSRAGYLLLKAFEERASLEKVDWVFLSLEARSPIPTTSLTKRGYRLQEKSFIKETASWLQPQ